VEHVLLEFVRLHIWIFGQMGKTTNSAIAGYCLCVSPPFPTSAHRQKYVSLQRLMFGNAEKPDEQQVLRFSRAGYHTQEAKHGNLTTPYLVCTVHSKQRRLQLCASSPNVIFICSF
jgi:hypothetical protein